MVPFHRKLRLFIIVEFSRKMEVFGCLLLPCVLSRQICIHFSRIQTLNLDINFKFEIFILILLKYVNFQLTYFFQPHYGPGVNSTSNRNEYQESSWG
jgi:hypothetical protein